VLCEVELPFVPYQVEAELRIVRDEKHEDRRRARGYANAQREAQGRAFAARVDESASGER
jgi:hypothetical protein